MRHLSAQVGSDGWCGLTLDPATLVATGGIHEHGLSPTAIRRLLEIEYGEADVNLLVDLARARSPSAALSVALGGALDRSPRFRDVLVPSDYCDDLRVILRSGPTWGALVLFRAPRSGTFTQDDAGVAAQVSRPAAGALAGALLTACAGALESIPDRGVVVLGPDSTIESATTEAARLLDDLAEEGPPDPGGVPHALQSVALEARRRARPADEVDLVSRSRARTRSGRWITLHASVLAGGAQRVVVFIEPSRPLEIASLILQAYGLTKREGEVVRLVLHGLDTEQIGEALEISPYTVQDHLKSIFDKAGVSSRKELVARIFFTQYVPRMSSPIGPDGWFADTGPAEGPRGRR
jgi:DNA-binding CsgD family transcriptional regulator